MHLSHSLGSAALLVALSTLATIMTPAEAAKATASKQLTDCLKPLGSKVITSNMSAYDKERYAFDLRFDYKPDVIVKAKSASDIQTAVKCAKDAKVPVTPRSGGHSFEGYCVGGQDGALVIDLAGLGSVKVDKAKGTAKVGSGVRLGKLYLELYNQGGYTINAGTCPSVGIGGHALGGGFGLLARKKGLLIDSIIEMEVVDANGKLLKVNAKENKDLFYALRGAGGGSFGVVTSFTVVPFKPADKVTSFTYDWKISDYEKVLTAYVNYQASASRDVGVEMNVGPSGLELYGIFQGRKKDLKAALAKFLDNAPTPNGNDIRETKQIEAQLRFAFINGAGEKDIEALELKSPYKAGDSRYTKGKSLVYPTALKPSTIKLLGKWGAKTPKGSTANYIIVDLWGGAVKDVSASDTSFIHRDAHTVFEFVVEWDQSSNPKPGKADCKDCIKWMDDMYAEFLADYKNYSDTVRGYQNYIDLAIPNWQEAYYGQAMPRLKEIKSSVDPSNVFRFPQSIPLK